MAHIILLGTADTKSTELLHLRERLLAHCRGTKVTFIDFGRTPVANPAINISQAFLLSYADSIEHNGERLTRETLQNMARGDLLATMTKLVVACVQDMLRIQGPEAVHGIIAAGGSSNSSVAAAAMQACPIGLPKLLVSTIASGDVSPIIGESDISLMYSVVDIAGLNSVLRNVLDNAAAAMAGMARAYAVRTHRRLLEGEVTKPLQIGITMFGVTTPCVDAARQRLEAHGAEVYVFHATGTGGRAMERLVQEGALDGVLDVTTTEICDFLVGGNMSAGPDRLRGALELGVPCLVSLGACDMVNFGPRHSVPEKFRDRKLLQHNTMVTLMRTSRAECVQVADWIADRLNKCAKDKRRVQVWIPQGGVSMLDVVGAAFHDHDADAALFDTIESRLKDTGISVIRDQRDINDHAFAVAMADRLLEMLKPDYCPSDG